MATMTQKDAWQLAGQTVAAHRDELRALTTHAELFEWAKANSLATQNLFPKFKSELRKQVHVDYDALRAQAMTERAASLSAAASDAPLIRLCTAGDIEVNSFAVCDVEGGDPWYGLFHEKDRVTDQDEADLSAARKAIYLAGQARQYGELDVVRLELTVSNHMVDADSLRDAAVRGKVVVEVTVVDGDDDNPALEMCRVPGFRTWREVSLTDLIAQEG